MEKIGLDNGGSQSCPLEYKVLKMPFWFISLMLHLTAIGLFAYTSREIDKEKYIREEAGKYADTDGDGKTTGREWLEVYRKLGIQYDELKPRELTTSELEKYINLSK